jgi:hypothetical protein
MVKLFLRAVFTTYVLTTHHKLGMKEGLKGETRGQRQSDITDIRKFTLS